MAHVKIRRAKFKQRAPSAPVTDDYGLEVWVKAEFEITKVVPEFESAPIPFTPAESNIVMKYAGEEHDGFKKFSYPSNAEEVAITFAQDPRGAEFTMAVKAYSENPDEEPADSNSVDVEIETYAEVG